MTTDLSAALGDAPEFRSTAVVRASRLTEARTWRSRRGSELVGAPGDWLATDGVMERTVAAAIFESSYCSLPDGRFAKDATARALRVGQPVEVSTIEGLSTARPGDWVLQGVDGELWPVSDAHFRRHYEPVRA